MNVTRLGLVRFGYGQHVDVHFGYAVVFLSGRRDFGPEAFMIGQARPITDPKLSVLSERFFAGVDAKQRIPKTLGQPHPRRNRAGAKRRRNRRADCAPDR
jgi:hypothetical protein